MSLFFMRQMMRLLLDIETADTDYARRYDLIFHAMHTAGILGYERGFRHDDTAGSSLDGFRNVAYIELPTGQVSWHMPDHPHQWDGHTTAMKYERCGTYAALVREELGVFSTGDEGPWDYGAVQSG